MLEAEAHELTGHLDVIIMVRLYMEHGRKELVDRPGLDKFLHHLYFHHLDGQPLYGHGEV